jgi:hypothetical protein
MNTENTSGLVVNESVVPKELSEQFEKTVSIVPESSLADHLIDDSVVDPNDLLLPKVLLMQGLSDLVTEGKAIMGELRHSLEGRLLGSHEKPLEVIPLLVRKSWVVFVEENGKLEYSGEVPFTSANAHWLLDDVWEGKKVRRDKSLNLYCCLPGEVDEGVFLPYVISFRRTSYKAGRKVETARETLKMFKKPLAFKTLLISAYKDKNDKGVYFVFDVIPGRKTTEAELAGVSPWFDLIKNSAVKVDDSELKKDETVVSEFEIEESES